MNGEKDNCPISSTEASLAVWPVWARWAVTALLVFHGGALLSGTLAAGNPASSLERSVADMFVSYHELIDQGYTYRYYAPEPGPTPVVTAQPMTAATPKGSSLGTRTQHCCGTTTYSAKQASAQ